MRWHLILTLPLLLAAVPMLQDPAPQQVAPRVIRPAVVMTGAHSAIDKPAYHRLRAPQELARTWVQHLGKPAPDGEYGFFYNEDGVPEVDFASYDVLAIFGGQGWNSAGFQVLSITDEEDRRVVRFDHKHYQTVGSDGSGGGERVSLFGFFVLPRTDLPIVLEENVQSRIGKPPEWKERARL